MNTQTFCPRTIIGKAADIYKAHWKDFLLTLLVFAVLGGISMIGSHIDPVTGVVERSGIGVVSQILSWLAIAYVTIGYIKYVLALIDGKSPKVDSIFQGVSSWKHFISYLVTKLLVKTITSIIAFIFVGIPLFIGMFFFFIRGTFSWISIVVLFVLFLISLFISMGFLFAETAVAEERTGILESIKLSWRIAKGYKGKLLLLTLLVIFLNVLGVFVFGLGLLVTIPISSIAYLIAYRELLTLHGEA